MGRFLFAAVLGQVLASALLVVLPSLYSKMLGREAWPILIPTVAAAFCVQVLVPYHVLRSGRKAHPAWFVALSVLICWISGLALFFAFSRSGHHWAAPRMAWAAGLAVFMIMLSIRGARIQLP